MPNGLRVVLFLACCALLTAAGPVRADSPAGVDEIRAGPQVGAKIPHDLSTVDQNGQHQDFKALARERGLLILFSRSVDW